MTPDERSAAEREMNDLNTAIVELQAAERKGIATANEIIVQRDVLSLQHKQANAALRLLQAQIDSKTVRRNELQQTIKNHDNAERKRKRDEADKKRKEEEAAKVNQQAEPGNGE